MADPILSEASAAAAALLGGLPDSIEAIRGAGRNSGVYRVLRGGERFALKRYPPRAAGERDRVGSELAALRFMRAHGITEVPRPIAGDAERGYAALEWIEGEQVTAPGEAEIDAATAFLAKVHRLRLEPEAADQPAAAEACLSGGEVAAQIERRLVRLEAVPDEPALAAFLGETVRPLAAELGARARAGYAERGIDFAAPIPEAARTLCPADFGFHNALREPTGRLVFIDFDYFGWDDPVKLVADFLLHPGMQLSDALRRRFREAVAGIYGKEANFGPQLRLLHPLYAVRWSLILLNEFLPERWANRVNAGTAGDWPAAKRRQLERAAEWVRKAHNDLAQFPSTTPC